MNRVVRWGRQRRPEIIKGTMLLVTAIVLPLSIDLLAMFMDKGTNGLLPVIGLVAALATGGWCVLKLPTKKWIRVLALLVYIPLMGVELVICDFEYVCTVYHSCL